MPNKVLRLHFASPTEIAVECDQTNDTGVSVGKMRTRASLDDAPADLKASDLFGWVQSEVDRQVATLPANLDVALITGKLHVARELSADIAQKTQQLEDLGAKIEAAAEEHKDIQAKVAAAAIQAKVAAAAKAP